MHSTAPCRARAFVFTLTTDRGPTSQYHEKSRSPRSQAPEARIVGCCCCCCQCFCAPPPIVFEEAAPTTRLRRDRGDDRGVDRCRDRGHAVVAKEPCHHRHGQDSSPPAGIATTRGIARRNDDGRRELDRRDQPRGRNSNGLAQTLRGCFHGLSFHGFLPFLPTHTPKEKGSCALCSRTIPWPGTGDPDPTGKQAPKKNTHTTRTHAAMVPCQWDSKITIETELKTRSDEPFGFVFVSNTIVRCSKSLLEILAHHRPKPHSVPFRTVPSSIDSRRTVVREGHGCHSVGRQTQPIVGCHPQPRFVSMVNDRVFVRFVNGEVPQPYRLLMHHTNHLGSFFRRETWFFGGNLVETWFVKRNLVFQQNFGFRMDGNLVSQQFFFSCLPLSFGTFSSSPCYKSGGFANPWQSDGRSSFANKSTTMGTSFDF